MASGVNKTTCGPTGVDINYTLLPNHVQNSLKQILLDSLASMVGGSRMRESIPLDKYLEYHFAQLKENRCMAQMLLNGSYTMPSIAAMAAAALMELFGGYPWIVVPYDGELRYDHPCALVVPSLLAVSSHLTTSGQKVNGERFLTALYIGVELPLRLATNCEEFSLTTCTLLGVLEMSAWLLQTSQKKKQEAINILLQTLPADATFKDPLRSGVLAKTAVDAIFMASAGLSMPPHSLMDRTQDLTALLKTPGDTKLCNSLFMPCTIHPLAASTMMCLEELIRSNPSAFTNETIKDIESVKITTSYEASKLTVIKASCERESRSSIKWPVAFRLSNLEYIPAGLTFFKKSPEDPILMQLLDKIQVDEKEDFSRAFPNQILSGISIHFRGGEDSIQCTSNMNQLLLTEVAVNEKFERIGPAVIGCDPTRITMEMVAKLEQQDDVIDCLRLLYERPPWD